MARAGRKLIHSVDEIPTNLTEKEEVRFWDEHEPGPELAEGAEWDPAILALLPPPRPVSVRPTRPISLRLDDSMLARLKALAQRRGMRYQTLLKELVERGLVTEEEREAAGPEAPPDMVAIVTRIRRNLEAAVDRIAVLEAMLSTRGGR